MASTRSRVAAATAVATHGTDVVFAGIYSMGFADCEGEPGDGGIFVVFADSGLVSTEAVCFPATSDFEVTGIAVEVDGSGVWIAGSYNEELTVGTETLTTDDATPNAFVFSIGLASPHAPIGLPIEGKGPGEQSIKAIAARPKGGFVVAGSFQQELQLGGKSATAAADSSDIFLALFDATGMLHGELHSWGGDDDDEAGNVAAVGDVIYLAGEVDGGELEFDGGQKVRAEDSVAGFVVAFPDEGPDLGDPLWVAQFSAEDLDVTKLAVSANYVFVGGYVNGVLELEDGTAVPGACEDMFVSRILRPDGTPRGTSRCGDANLQTLVGLGTAFMDDEVFFAAELSGSIDLGQTKPLESAGDIDILVGQVLPP